jgi:hypothetical protein
MSQILVDEGEIVEVEILDLYRSTVSIDAKYLVVSSRQGALSPLQLHHLASHINYAWRQMAANPLQLLEGHWPDDNTFIIFAMDLHSSASSNPEKAFKERFLSNLFTNLRNGTPAYKTNRRGEVGERALRRAFFSVYVAVDRTKVLAYS